MVATTQSTRVRTYLPETKGPKDTGDVKCGVRLSDHAEAGKFQRTALLRKTWPAARNYTLQATHLIVDPVERGHRDLTLAALPFPRGNEKGRRALSKRPRTEARRASRSEDRRRASSPR